MDRRPRHARLTRIRKVVRQNDIARWISSQLQDIRDLASPGRPRNRSARRRIAS
jgi:trehalose-6-phosphate synthase